jgi:tripartite-type tricarboxylate transporter receptor subunit TctC
VNGVGRVAKPLSLVGILGLLAAGCSEGGSNEASGGGAAEACFEGETVEFAVPYDAGGGYDQYARILAPALEEELGATVVVRNEPGAGGLLSLNKNQATSPDEPRLQILEGFSSMGAQIGGAEGVEYDLTEWPWVGRLIAEPEVVFVAADSPYETWQDVVDAGEEVKFGSAGPGGSDFIHGTVLAEAFDAPMKLTTGFAGGPEILVALLRGDVQVTETSLYTTLPNIESGEVRPLLVLGNEPAEELPDVPIPADFEGELEEEGMAALNGLAAMIEIGRAVAVTPGTDPACVEELQQAFDTVTTDQEFLAQTEEAGRPVAPISGEELDELVQTVFEGAEGGVLESTLQGIYSGS